VPDAEGPEQRESCRPDVFDWPMLSMRGHGVPHDAARHDAARHDVQQGMMQQGMMCSKAPIHTTARM
jgi:hypothetical protein